MNWYKKIIIAGNETSWLSPDGKFYPNSPGSYHEDAAVELKKNIYNDFDESDAYEFMMQQGWIRVGNSNGAYPNQIIGNNFLTKSINYKQKKALIDFAIESGKKIALFDNGTPRDIVLWQKEEESEYVTSQKKFASKANMASWLSPDGKFYPITSMDHGIEGKDIIQKIYNNKVSSDINVYEFLMKKGWIRVTYIHDTIYANNYVIDSIAPTQKSQLKNLAIESGMKTVRFDGSVKDYIIWEDNYTTLSNNI